MYIITILKSSKVRVLALVGFLLLGYSNLTSYSDRNAVPTPPRQLKHRSGHHHATITKQNEVDSIQLETLEKTKSKERFRPEDKVDDLYLDPETKKRFQQKRDHLRKLCQDPDFVKMDDKSLSMKDITKKRTVDLAFHRIRWCRIPKVGTTFLQYTVPSRLRQWAETHPAEAAERWTHNKSTIVFLREPYSRLVSGYLNKVLLTPDWWPTHGRHVMVGAGLLNNTDPWDKRCAAYATFSDFINYVVQSETTGKGKTGGRNEHFMPMHDLCGFCAVDYTYIGSLETYKEDLGYILKAAKINISVESEPHKEFDTDFYEFPGKEEFLKCTNTFKMMQNIWFSFQARGVIPRKLPMPVTETESSGLSLRAFKKFTEVAYSSYKGTFDSSLQRKEVMSEMYQTIPLQVRLRLRTLFMKDFQITQTDPSPPEVFPKNTHGIYI